jgi:hypothetical protein
VDPVIVFSDPILLIAQWHNLQIVDIGGLMLSRHVREVGAATTTLSTRFKGGVAGLNFIRSGTPTVDKSTRGELTDMMKAHRDLQIRSITVLEETGIAASALRAMMRTMLDLSGSHQLEIVATPEEGARSVLPSVRPRIGENVTRVDLEAAIRQVRLAYDKQRSNPRSVSANG